jgi:type I restriction enzyme S subunit
MIDRLIINSPCRKLLWPDASILGLFEEFATPLHEQISALRKTNETSAQARDLLLPRLMNGEIAL